VLARYSCRKKYVQLRNCVPKIDGFIFSQVRIHYKFFENVANFKYSEKTITNKNLFKKNLQAE
jgi:hypothetical protein